MSRRQRETLRAIEEQLLREDPGLAARLGGRFTWRGHWMALAVISALIFVAGVVVGYTPAGVLGAAGGILAGWRLWTYYRRPIQPGRPDQRHQSA